MNKVWDHARGAVALAVILGAVVDVWKHLDTKAQVILIVCLAFAGIFGRSWLRQRGLSPSGTQINKVNPIEPDLSVVSVTFDRSSEPNITYKSKVRVVIRNNDRQAVVVKSPLWLTRSNDVGTQSPFCSSLQRQGPRGLSADDWAPKDQPEANVLSGECVRAWVGLDQRVSGEELTQRRKRLNLGVLVVPVAIGHVQTEVRLIL